MKIIPKFAQGGSWSDFFTVYDPLPAQQAQLAGRAESSSSKSSKKDSSDEEKGKLTQKDFFNMIKDLDGLPNEMASIVQTLTNTFELENITGKSMGDLSTRFLLNLMLLKLAALNKTKFDKAVEVAEKNDSMSELAITEAGNLLVLNGTELVELRPDLYISHRDLYNPLTVSQLAYVRSHLPNYVGDDSSLNTIANSMGYEGFQELIAKGLQSLGNSTTDVQGQVLLKDQALKGLSILLKAQLLAVAAGIKDVGLEGLYEYHFITEDLLALILALKTYLTATLPKKARVWAMLKTGQSEDEAVGTLIEVYLMGRQSPKSTYSVDYKGTEDKVKGGSSGSSGDGDDMDKMKMTTSLRWLIGQGVHQNFVVNSGTKHNFAVNATIMPIVDAEGKLIGANQTLQKVTEGDYSGILDFEHATIAGVPVDSSALNYILISDGKIARIDYPIDPTKPGKVPMVDPDIVKRRAAAHSTLKKNGIDIDNPTSIAANYQYVKKVYEAVQLPVEFKPSGLLDDSTWAMFGVMNASFEGNILSGDFNKELVEEITDDGEFERTAKYLAGANTGYAPSKGWLWGDHLYKGTVWIPVDNSYLAAMASLRIKPGEATELEKANQSVQNGVTHGPMISH